MDFQQTFYNKQNPPGSHNQAANGRVLESGPIQFVFVDESARDSKRLKITRACESCRRRKVKCDAPNVAPGESCTSCKRLKVVCVMHSSVVENDEYSQERIDDDKPARTSSKAMMTSLDPSGASSQATQNSSPRSQAGMDMNASLTRTTPAISTRGRRSSSAHRRMQSSSVISHIGEILPSNRPRTATGLTSQGDPTPVNGVNTLTDIFGNLDIQLSGRATFLDDTEHAQHCHLMDSGVSHKRSSGRITAPQNFPISWDAIEQYLPPDDLAMDLLDLYFENIHPYLPVLNKTMFLQYWMSTKRQELSPYLVLSLFACAARYSSDPRVRVCPDDAASKGDLWQSLVMQYREEFQDAPRLCTLQANVINLKALETRPKLRGYSYRGWMLLSLILRMGRDLGLHRSLSHKAHDTESVCRRRVWQVCLIMDQMMGTAQGREHQLDMAEVDLTLLPQAHTGAHEFDEEDIKTHNDFVYMAGLMKLHRRSTEVHGAVGIKFPFSAEPAYPALAQILSDWRANLPAHLNFNSLVDKVLPSHFIAHLHLSHYMIICLLHRPWIVSIGEYGLTGEWRDHLRLCNAAAREALAVYELLLDQYGAAGPQWMLRGTNYTIYGVVIITMIHAVCLTCPEQEFSKGAQDAFIRAIKVLDHLSEICPTPQFELQLTALKQIFGDSSGSNDSPALNTRTMPPELASLQEQYRKMREARTRDRQFPAESTDESHYGTYHAGFQHTTNTDDVPQPYGALNMHDEYFQQVPVNMGHRGLNEAHMSQRMGHTQDPSGVINTAMQNDWDPAGLIGAWHLNFPGPTAHIADFNHAGFDGSLAMMQGPPLHEHMQYHYPQYTALDGHHGA